MPEPIVGLIVWVVAALAIGFVARLMGRDAADYFWGSLILTPILGVYALVVGKPER